MNSDTYYFHSAPSPADSLGRAEYLSSNWGEAYIASGFRPQLPDAAFDAVGMQTGTNSPAVTL